MLKFKRAVAAIVGAVVIAAMFSGCSGSDSYVTVNGVGTSNSEFLFNLKASMYSVMSSAGQTQSTKSFWTTRSNGVTPFDTAVDKAVQTTTLYAVVDKKYDEYKLTYGADQEAAFTQAYNNLISNFSSKEEYISYMQQQGVSDDDVKAILKRSIKQSQLKDFLFSKNGELYISDDALKAYYNDNYYRVKHILFLTIDTSTYQALSDDKVAQAKKDAEDTLAQLKAGADFDTLMRQKTQDPGSLTSENIDGYIFATGEADEAFETAAKKLKVGEMSDIVKGTYGYHIIKRLSLDEKPQYFETNKATILDAMKTSKYNALLTSWTSAAKVEKNATKIKSLDPVALLTPNTASSYSAASSKSVK